jgi:hypothetical protein
MAAPGNKCFLKLIKSSLHILIFLPQPLFLIRTRGRFVCGTLLAITSQHFTLLKPAPLNQQSAPFPAFSFLFENKCYSGYNNEELYHRNYKKATPR